METDPKLRKRLKPVAATATKVGEIGTGDSKQDILKLEVNPEDAGIFDQRTDRDDDKGKGDKGDDEMSEAEIEAKANKIFDERIGKMKLQETVEGIRNISGRVDERLEGVSEKIGGMDERIGERIGGVDEKIGGMDLRIKEYMDKLGEKQDQLKEKQDESCTGIECLKKEISEIKELKESVGNLRKELTEEISKSAKEYATCAGKKGCNSDIPVGSSYCPNCGLKIKEWPGQPDWVPQWERNKKE